MCFIKKKVLKQDWTTYPWQQIHKLATYVINVCVGGGGSSYDVLVAFRVRQFAYIAYVCMPTFIVVHMILDVCMLTRMVIFYLWPLIYLFVLRRDRFFTVYICFK